MPDALKLEAKAWLCRAHDDLGAARKLLSDPDPGFDDAADAVSLATGIISAIEAVLKKRFPE